MAKKTTFEIVERSRVLVQKLIEAEGVADDELEALLESVGDDIKEKIDACVYTMRIADAEIDFYKKEAARLTARKKEHEITVARMKLKIEELVLAEEERTGESKVKTKRVTAWMADRKSLEIEDLEELVRANRYESWIQWKPTIDRVELKKLVESGETVEGASMRLSRTLSIR